MLWILLGIIAGLVLPIQTLVNTRLRASTGTPFSSSLISFAVGTVTLLIIATAVTGGDFGISRAFGEPLWIWLGGLLGVVALTGKHPPVSSLGRSPDRRSSHRRPDHDGARH